MNQLPLGKRYEILSMLVEGNSLRSTSSLANVSINTVTKLLIDVGEVCAEYQNKIFHNLACERMQVDEMMKYGLFATLKKS